MKKYHFLIFILFFLGVGTISAQETVLLNFDSINGASPGYGSLVRLGNKLYGMTDFGGVNNDGVVFSIDTNGKGYKTLLNFDSINGANPQGSLIISGNILYGMTEFGGGSNNGVVFAIDTNGKGYKTLYSFNDSVSNPFGSLTLSGGVLYGMASNSLWGAGCIFSMDTNGNGFKDLFDFSSTNGSYPTGDLLLSGNVLYGMTMEGYYYGNIFSINTNGSGFKDLLDFNSTNGNHPMGSLIFSGGNLYGMTEFGGTGGAGNIFSINTNGNGFRDLFDFNGTNGAFPFGSLIVSGSKFFGMASVGGTNSDGVVFSMDTNGSGYRNLFSFNDTNGATPHGSLIISGNVLYGMTSNGGINGDGAIFSFKDTLPFCENNYNQSICIVSTDTAINKNIVIWGRNNSPPDGSFNIYDSTSSSGWTLIGSVPDTALSEYIDTASSPTSQSYSYRISTVDSCGESALSPFNSTIYLQVIQTATGKDSLFWTPYVGFSAPYYLIYRGLSLNALTIIDSATGSTISYVDPLPPLGSLYLVEAINQSGGCVPTRKYISSHNITGTNTFASFSNGGIPSKTAGINEIGYPKGFVVISPNPNNGVFNLAIANGHQLIANSPLEVYNMLGEKVYTTKLNAVNTQIDLGNNASGIYLYRIITETGQFVSEGKFIKE